MTHVLIIEPSSAGLELLPTAKALGLDVCVFTANQDDRIIPLRYRSFANHIIEADTYDVDALYILAKKINAKSAFSAIIPGSEYHVPIAAKLANLFSLPGISLNHVNHLRIKSNMRNALKKANVPTPPFHVVNSTQELQKLMTNLCFPCVLKPIASAGSMHVSRANTPNELLQAYQAFTSDTWTELGKGLGTTALVEEYIAGEEFSVEGFIENNQANVISITKKFLSPEPLFIEMGHIVSANLNIETQDCIKKYIQKVVQALGINLGIFHAELRLGKEGPLLLEIAGRLPGCRISDLIFLAQQINLYEIMIYAHLGWPISIKYIQQTQYAGMRYFDLKGLSYFHQVHGLESLQSLPGFHEFNLLKLPGEKVPPLSNFQGRVANCIFTGPDYNAVLEKFSLAEKIISFS